MQSKLLHGNSLLFFCLHWPAIACPYAGFVTPADAPFGPRLALVLIFDMHIHLRIGNLDTLFRKALVDVHQH